MRFKLNQIVLVLLLVPLVVACTTTSNQTATSAAQPSASTSSGSSEPTATAAGAAALDTAINAVWQAMQDRNQTRLRDLMGDQLRQRTSDGDMQRLTSCIPPGSTVTLTDHSVETTDNSAKVTLTFNVSSDSGTPTTVTRVWNFIKLPNGTWLLLSVPSCPFQ